MKGSVHFINTIKQYLDLRAQQDSLFAETYSKPNKNIDDCITYILNCVQKSQCNGFDDSEIYNMAVHYYDEDIIDVGNPLDCKVYVNHFVELTDEEKEQAKQSAFMEAQREASMKFKIRRKTKVNKNTQSVTMLDLFAHETEN